jgi:hypothetical protein
MAAASHDVVKALVTLVAQSASKLAKAADPRAPEVSETLAAFVVRAQALDPASSLQLDAELAQDVDIDRVAQVSNNVLLTSFTLA